MVSIVFNLIALVPLVVGLVVGISLYATNPWFGFLGGGLTCIAIDVLFRMRSEHRADQGRAFALLHPRAGGHVFYVPCWLLAAGFMCTTGYWIDDTVARAAPAVAAPPVEDAAPERPPPPFCPAGLVERSGTDDTGGQAAERRTAVWCEDANGAREGPFEARFASGSRAAEGAYHAGKRTGEWVTLFDSGRVAQKATFVDDVVSGRLQVFNEQGQVVRDETVTPAVEPAPKSSKKRAAPKR